MHNKSSIMIKLIPYIIVTIIVFLWYYMTNISLTADPILIPKPQQVIQAFIKDRVWMVQGLFASLGRLLLGYIIAMPLATYLGVWSAWKPIVHRIFYPFIRVLSPIPPLIYSPFLVALLPSFKSASMVMIVIGIFMPTYLNVVHRLDHIEEKILVPALMLELNDYEMVHYILLPYAYPGVLTGCRTILSTSFMILTFAEMMGADSGLGFYIRYFADYGNYTNVIAGIILTSIVILIINSLFGFVEKVAVPWRT